MPEQYNVKMEIKISHEQNMLLRELARNRSTPQKRVYAAEVATSIVHEFLEPLLLDDYPSEEELNQLPIPPREASNG